VPPGQTFPQLSLNYASPTVTCLVGTTWVYGWKYGDIETIKPFTVEIVHSLQ
jgi:hypothetical protein